LLPDRCGERSSSSSEETQQFLQQCDCLVQLLQQTLHCCTQLLLPCQASVQQLLHQVQHLQHVVQEAGGLASGGIFEWVDSPLIVVSG
jgi:hypothetical protein